MMGKICFLLLGCFMMLQMTAAGSYSNSVEVSSSPPYFPNPPAWLVKWCKCHPKDPRCVCLAAWNKYCKCKPAHPLCYCLKCCKWWQK